MPALIADDSIMESMNIEELIISPISKEVGVVVLSADSSLGKRVKIYSVVQTKVEDEYVIGSELFNSAFEDVEFAGNFLDYFSEMSAIELLFAMQKASDEFTKPSTESTKH